MKLPNAPLVEVVFEFRWRVEPFQGMDVFGIDPGFQKFAKSFSEHIAEEGFTNVEDISVAGQPPLANHVVYRYRRDQEASFPLLQIGHGIMACNMGPEYDWRSYKELVKLGLDATVRSHPRNEFAPLIPNGLELRYIDAFDAQLLGHQSVERFLNEKTNFRFSGMSFLQSQPFKEKDGDFLRLVRGVEGDENMTFMLEIGTGTGEDAERAIIMTNRIRSRAQELNLGTNIRTIKSNVIKWCNSAHELTSPFFKSFITDDLMDVFKNRKSSSTSGRRMRNA